MYLISIASRASEIGGVDQRGACGVEFGNKAVEITAGLGVVHGLKRAPRRGKVRGTCTTRNVGIAVAVGHNTVRQVSVLTGSSKVGGVDQGGACCIEFG